MEDSRLSFSILIWTASIDFNGLNLYDFLVCFSYHIGISLMQLVYLESGFYIFNDNFTAYQYCISAAVTLQYIAQFCPLCFAVWHVD